MDSRPILVSLNNRTICWHVDNMNDPQTWLGIRDSWLIKEVIRMQMQMQSTRVIPV